jgi:hypothetical protein
MAVNHKQLQYTTARRKRQWQKFYLYRMAAVPKDTAKMTAAEASACPRLLDTFLPVDRPDPFQYNKKNQETGKTTEGEITA